ncbi:hypothetical protein [Agromyces sp. SYSU T00266]
MSGEPAPTDAAPAPFTMVGAGAGMICEGDVCFVPPADPGDAIDPAR